MKSINRNKEEQNHNHKAIIEALLFISEKPVLLEQLSGVLDGLSPAQIRAILDEMAAEYLDSSRGIRIVEIAGGFKMVTASCLSPFLKKFYRKAPERLSRPALETLSIIAYKQPVTRLEIESIRGVDISGIVRSLTSKGIVRTAGRRKAPGRPFVYVTTRQFLEYFGLRSLAELPKPEEFDKKINQDIESKEE